MHIGRDFSILNSESRLKEAIQKMLEARNASKPMQEDQSHDQEEAKNDNAGGVMILRV